VTYTTGFGFDERIYWTFIQLATTFRTSLFSTRHARLLTKLYYATPPGVKVKVKVKVSHIATDGQSISKYWCRAPSGAHDQIFISRRQLRPCFCVAPSLTRGQVCLLYMVLALASVVFLGQSLLGLVTIFYGLRFVPESLTVI
jgi:hypothetical protein